MTLATIAICVLALGVAIAMSYGVYTLTHE
jgi:hypothetical protein